MQTRTAQQFSTQGRGFPHLNFTPSHVGLDESGDAPGGGIFSGGVSVTSAVGAVDFGVSSSAGFGGTLEPITAESYASASWQDSFILTSATLPKGTPVQLQLSTTFAGFTAHLDGGLAGNGGQLEDTMDFSVTPYVGTSSGALSTIFPVVKNTVSVNTGDRTNFATTTETTGTYKTAPIFTQLVGDKITVAVDITGGTRESALGNAFGNPYIEPDRAYLVYPYSFNVLSPTSSIGLTGASALDSSMPDVSLIDAAGHNWLTPVSGPPLNPIDPFFISYSPPAATPEPSSLALLGVGSLGLLGLGVKARKRKAD